MFFRIETSNLIYSAKQKDGFCMKCNTEWVNGLWKITNESFVLEILSFYISGIWSFKVSPFYQVLNDDPRILNLKLLITTDSCRWPPTFLNRIYVMIIFLEILENFSDKLVLTFEASTAQNGLTPSNNSSAKADELLKCVWPFSGVGA